MDVDGTAFVSGAPPLFDEYLQNVTRMAKAGGGTPLIYLHTQISTGNAICNATVPPLGQILDRNSRRFSTICR